MGKFKISIARPEDFEPALWDRLNEKLIRLLHEHYGLCVDTDEACNWQLSEFLTDSQVRDLALMTFGNDFNYTVNVVSNLILIGNGACPLCGCNRRKEVDKNSITGAGYRCLACGTFERYDDTI